MFFAHRAWPDMAEPGLIMGVCSLVAMAPLFSTPYRALLGAASAPMLLVTYNALMELYLFGCTEVMLGDTFMLDAQIAGMALTAVGCWAFSRRKARKLPEPPTV